MIYIKLEENEEFIKNKNTFFKMIYKLKNKLFKIRVEHVENKKLIILNNLEEDTLRKLSKYIKANAISRACLSNNLLCNSFFKNYLINQNVKIYDGRWLFKNLTYECISYVCGLKKENMQSQEISILSNNIDRLIVNIITRISKEVKSINIITRNENKFRKLEKELYSDYGIVLNMNNNYKRSLAKSDIIINLDFTNDDINRYIICPNSCIINISNNTLDIKSNIFKGIICEFYEIFFPNKYIRNLLYFKGFNSQILYESFIYKNTSPENIIKELEKDNVKLQSLIGKNGVIRKTEFTKISKNVIN